MKRSAWEGQTVVYRFGVPRRVDGQVVDLDDLAMAQLRAAHDLRNELVAVERRHAELVQAIWATDPQVAEAQRDLDDVDELLTAAVAVARAERSADRTAVTRADSRDAIAELRARQTAARHALRAARDVAAPALRPAMAMALRAKRALTAAGGPFSCANTPGVAASTWSDVVDHHRTAVDQIGKARAAGRPAEMRFHRWDGSGTLRAQLRRPAGAPARTPAVVAAGTGIWRNIARLTPCHDPDAWAAMSRAEQRRARLGRLRMTLGRGDHLDIPVIVHRPIPADADITDVRITRRRIAGGHRLSVQVTCRVPDPAPPTGGRDVAVHIGWRSLGRNGGTRVAVIAAAGPLDPTPGGLDGIVRLSTDRRHAEVIMPPEWNAVWDRVEAIRSTRDRDLERLRADIAAQLPVDGIEATAGDVARWRSPGRFVALGRDWPAGHPAAVELEAWRRRDRRRWETEAHTRDKIVARRRDAWRNIAAWLTRPGTGSITIDTTPVAQLTLVPDDNDTAQARAARANRQTAAPAELRAAIETKARMAGLTTTSADNTHITRTHIACGTTITDPDAPAAAIAIWCPTCKTHYDQDHNAARHLLARNHAATA